MNSWQEIIRLPAVNSTNEYLSNRLKEKKLDEGTIIYSLFQTAGKGQASNIWESKENENILLSLIIYPDFIGVANQFALSKAVSLGIAKYCQQYVKDIKIKWPNDIYYENKKLAGILIENSIKGNRIEKCIVGIGLNLNQDSFSENIPNPTSLNLITNKKYKIEKEVIKLRQEIKFYYNQLKENINGLDEHYINKMYKFNHWASYRINGETLKAKIIGISDFGHLQLLFENKEKKEFDLKEIEFVI